MEVPHFSILFFIATKMIAARRIQRVWFAHMAERNHERMMERAMQDTRIAKGGSAVAPEGAGNQPNGKVHRHLMARA